MTTPDAVAMYFGTEPASLFGWLHQSAAGARPAFGAVICNPFGFEEVCAHRTLKQLAQACATAGVPTLRFDYAGCGNSRGDEYAPDMLGAWQRSIGTAIDHLKSSTGVARVCLIGMRLGALLATLTALERDDVQGLVAIAPVIRGRDLVREMRILGDPQAPDASAAANDGRLESAGFLLTRETVEALGRVDLRAMPEAPAPHMLIVDRDDLPCAEEWHRKLASLPGAQAVLGAWPGYAAIMTNPQDAKIPAEIIDGVVATLAQWQRSTSAASPAGTPEPTPTATSFATNSMQSSVSHAGRAVAIREAIVQIDTGPSPLFGILTTPVDMDRRAGPQRRGVVMLNSGSVHHIGPSRLWVRLARRWAAQGISVLRIDLSGIADSPTRPGHPDNVVYSHEASVDSAAALSFMRERHGIKECDLMGLCSGAFHAMKAVVAGHDVTSALVINPLTYSWEDSALLNNGLNEYEVLTISSQYSRQIFSAGPWLKLLRGELDLRFIATVFARRVPNAARHTVSKLRHALGIAAPDGLGAELISATRSGARLRFVFADTDPGLALLRRHCGATLDKLVAQGRVSIDVVPNADHTFTRLDARERLLALLDTLLQCPSAAIEPTGDGNVRTDTDATRVACLP